MSRTRVRGLVSRVAESYHQLLTTFPAGCSFRVVNRQRAGFTRQRAAFACFVVWKAHCDPPPHTHTPFALRLGRPAGLVLSHVGNDLYFTLRSPHLWTESRRCGCQSQHRADSLKPHQRGLEKHFFFFYQREMIWYRLK